MASRTSDPSSRPLNMLPGSCTTVAMARASSRRLWPSMTALVACWVATCAWLLPPVVVPSASSVKASFRLIFRSSPEPSGPIYLPNETIPSCVWNPRVTSISLPAARKEGCFPFGAGQSVGIFMSPAAGASNYGQSNLKADVRIARLISGSIVVSPVLMTAEDASGGARPIEAYSGDHCLWVFAYGQYPRPDLYRISATSGAVLQRSTLNVAYPKLSANTSGARLGSLDDPARSISHPITEARRSLRVWGQLTWTASAQMATRLLSMCNSQAGARLS